MTLLRPGATLADAFDRAAAHYDLLVRLSPGYHGQLAGSARRLVERLPAGPCTVLDLGCGTGASTQALVRALAAAGRTDVRIEAVDVSAGMIEQARAKVWPDRVSFHCADAARDLSERPTASVGGILAAYLVRNVPDADELLAEAARVLIPGGALLVHDYSVAGSRVATAVWQGVCRGVIIPAAYLAARDVTLHRYLLESVLRFDSVDQLRDRMARAGFADITHGTVPGWERGIVHRLLGVRR